MAMRFRKPAVQQCHVPSTVTSKTPAGPLRVRAASPPSSDVFGTRWLSRTGPSEGKCWGEGEDATLHAKSSSPRYTNECETIGAAALRPLHCKAKARLRRSLLVPRPHLVRGPTSNSAHCNGPRVGKHITGLICNNFSVMTVYNLPLREYSGIVWVPEGINVLVLGRKILEYL
jgi:hypothetical protein